MVGSPFPAPLYQKIIVAYLWDWDRRVPHLFPLQPLGLQFNIDQNFTVVHIVHYLLSTFSPIKMKKNDNWNYVWENNLFWTFWHSSSHSRRDHTCTLPRLGPQIWGGPRGTPHWLLWCGASMTQQKSITSTYLFTSNKLMTSNNESWIILFFSAEFALCFDLLRMDFRLRIKIDKKYQYNRLLYS